MKFVVACSQCDRRHHESVSPSDRLQNLISFTCARACKMASKCEGETTLDLRSVQRERERERRRMRDRQRRQNMSLEQRERHLARRRRNYQLRRMRAENSKLDDQQNQNLMTPAECQENAVNLTVYNASRADLPFDGLQIMEKSVFTIDCGESGIQRPSRLRMNQIRHLARLLHTPVNDHQITVGDANPSENSSGEGRNKRLGLIHIKRLARALKSDNK